MYPHEQILKEEGIDWKKLPQKIKQQIGAFNMQNARYGETPNEKQKQSLTTISVKIADMIQDEIESGTAPTGVATPPAPPKPAQAEPNTPPAPAPVNGMHNAPPKSDLKAEIQKHIDRDGRIYHIDLKRLLNKRELDDKVEVEGVTLERSWAFYYPA